MLSVYFICIGKLKESFYQQACAEYCKRLAPYCKLTLLELPEQKLPQNPSPAQIEQALSRERAAILEKLPQSSQLVAFCIEGEMKTSEQLAQTVRGWEQGTARHIVLVMGGSYGLSEQLKAQASLRLSMSPMTFPHHLARVMALEQLYRAFKINEGSQYHK